MIALLSSVMSSGFAMSSSLVVRPGGCCAPGSSAGEHAGLLEERELVRCGPPLDDLSAGDAHEVAVRPHDLLAGRLGPEERVAAVGAADERMRRYLASFTHHVRLVHLEPQVGECPPERGVCLQHRVEGRG